MSAKQNYNTPVAIIGMGCFFPDASGLKNYWRLIFNGEDSITDVPDTHWPAADYFDADPRKPDHTYCKRGGFISPAIFDPVEFGIPPNILEATDTSQLFGLMAAKIALEDAGYGPSSGTDHDRTSVILGVTGTQELVIPLSSRLGFPKWRRALEASGISPEKTEEVIQRISDAYVPWQESSFPGLLGNVIAGRIANRLNLGGTNCAADAACASSMSGIYMALMELITGRSDMVVAGGVDTLNDIFMHLCFASTGILSPTGDARPFSKDADGTVLGEGVGIVILKRLDEAERDGDRVYAVIKSAGVSSDGKSQSIYAPNAKGQLRALRRAYKLADVDPGTVELVEAHGTGTRVGDRVELQALNQCFNDSSSDNNKDKQWCALGAVKSNIGHTKAAAGSAGLIKAALALYHKVLPPTLKADIPDPDLNIDATPFYLNTAARPWLSKQNHPRRCGVSAFGFGGSNFHLVLEEYLPDKKLIAWHGTVEIIALSASTPEMLIKQVNDLKKHVTNDSITANDIAREARLTRSAFVSTDQHRLLLVLNRPVQLPDQTSANSMAQALVQLCDQALDAMTDKGMAEHWHIDNIYYGGAVLPGKRAFLFPGQGSQYVDMGRDITNIFPQAFNTLESFNTQAVEQNSFCLSDFIYPLPATEKGERQNQETALRATAVAQPALGAVSVSMLKILAFFGVTPDVVGGHSYGELPALYAAGWLDEETLIRLSFARGELMALAGQKDHSGNNKPNGAMLAIKAPLDEIENLIKDAGTDVVLANRNSPDQGVASGSAEAIEQVGRLCKSKKFRCIKLPVAAAFHSHLVKDAQAPFEKIVRQVEVTPTRIPVYSNTTGCPYPSDVSEAKLILGGQLAHPVDFVNAIEDMYASGVRTFVEVGPKAVLSGLVKSILKGKAFQTVASDRSSGRSYKQNNGLTDMAHTLCHLASIGCPVNLERWEEAVPEKRKPGMRIPISGANYVKTQNKDLRIQKPKAKSQNSDNKTSEKIRNADSGIRNSSHLIPKTNPSSRILNTENSDDTLSEKKSIMPTANLTKMDTTQQHQPAMQPEYVSDALNTVREGLKAMQALQTQTAQTHQAFLETQTQASRTLEQMIASTRELTGALPDRNFVQTGIPQVKIEPQHVTEEPLSPAVHETPTVPYSAQMPPASAPLPPPKLTSRPVPNKKSVATPIAPVVNKEPEKTPECQTCSLADVPLTDNLLEVVSELTGYPTEMLEPDMDIEADLGIDSIKRVEILSALEEKIPDLPPVSPEIMGELHTLKQIAEHLKNAASDSPAAPVAEPDPISESKYPALTATPALAGNAVMTCLMEVVSELTGYPTEMLEPDMDIEADLGIDSIKRVEILSAMEEKQPNLPAVSPEMMGDMKTLGQIADYLNAAAGAEKSTHHVERKAVPLSDKKDTLTDSLLGVVSELTGYPPEMLEPDMDIEADLGIDSIKRVEILSALESKHPHLPAVSPEMMGELKTLKQITQYLLDASGAGEVRNQEKIADVKEEASAHIDTSVSEVERRLINVTELPPVKNPTFVSSSDRTILVTDDGAGLAQAIVTQLEAAQNNAMLIDPDELEIILKDQSALPALAGLIILPPTTQEESVAINFLKNALALVKYAAQDLSDAGSDGGALLATITRLDGAFGFNANSMNAPITGALAGLVKTAALEWENVHCRAIDIAPQWQDTAAIAQAVIAELFSLSAPVEVGLMPDGSNVKRLGLKLSAAPFSENQPLNTGIEQQDVIVISGGARGVTAAAAKALASHTHATMILLGRSPSPEPEPAWLKPARTSAEMKRAILENEFGNQPVVPAQVEKVYRTYQTNREINATLKQLEGIGVQARYYAADVRNQDAVRSVIQEVRKTYGPISGLIHAAGVLEDRLIVDKSIAQFENVFETKVCGFSNLLQALEADPLNQIVLFSSVAGRMGNKGQVDYAMANEALNKMAWRETHRRGNDCKVIALNWGPWDGGMVSSGLKNEFARRNIELIPLEAGALCMLHEMSLPENGPVEIVLGAGLTAAHKNAAPDETDSSSHDEALSLAFKRDVNLTSYPILKAHVLDGKPVVPFALMTEWIGHSALHDNPGMLVCGFDDMRILQGVKLDHSPLTIRLFNGRTRKNGNAFEVNVEIRNGMKKNGADLVHTRAKALLADTLSEPPVYLKPSDTHLNGYSRKMDEVYREILFHGFELQGIKQILGCTPQTMVAQINGAPTPDKWIQSPLRSRWLGDPLILDSAFQMAIIWCYEEKGAVSLPVYGKSYRQYREMFPSQGVTAVLEITEADNRKMKGDFTFLDADNVVVARLTGYEAIMDASLSDAFRNNRFDTDRAE